MFGQVDYGRGFVGDLVRYAEMLSFHASYSGRRFRNLSQGIIFVSGFTA